MFLQQVYRHNKWLFAGILFFIGMQILVNLKRGMVFSPWFHYGMYAAPMPMEDRFSVYLAAGGEQLPWSPQAWDKACFTLQQYHTHTNDSLYEQTISRLVRKAGLKPPAKKHFVYTLEEPAFRQWYVGYLAGYGLPMDSASPFRLAQLKWNGRELVEIETSPTP